MAFKLFAKGDASKAPVDVTKLAKNAEVVLEINGKSRTVLAGRVHRRAGALADKVARAAAPGADTAPAKLTAHMAGRKAAVLAKKASFKAK